MLKKLKNVIKMPLFAPLFSTVLLLVGFLLRRESYGIASAIIFGLSVLICGIPVFYDAVLGLLRRDFFDEKFLMSLAAIGAFVIGEFSEGAAVMIFYRFGEWFEQRAVAKSRTSIKSLMDIRPDTATVFENGEWQEIDADDVEVGKSILVKTGERVPLDAIIEKGDAEVDTSALTGESLPRSVGAGDTVQSGFVVLSGVVTARVIHTAETSAASRILELVENAAERKSKEEKFITKFSKIYTPAVVISAVILAIIPPVFGLLDWKSAVFRALMFLVISCPCALLISIPMAFFGGIGGAARSGVLFKGANVLSAVSKVTVAAFDKTGTLTSGDFCVSEIRCRSMEKEAFLSLAASAEYYSSHPIAKCIKNAAAKYDVPTSTEEMAGLGMRAKVKNKEVLVGNRKLLSFLGISGPSELPASKGVVLVAVDGIYEGCIAVSDAVKPEAKEALSALKELGITKTVMLSGDNKEMALSVGNALGIDEVQSELSPEEKYTALQTVLKEKNGNLMYVGDGINDAPALALADVGVSMGDIGQDSAIEASDVVIMSDRLDKLPIAVKIARRTVKIAHENIAFALTVKLGILALVATGLLDAFGGMWLAVFADVGVCVLDVLNSCRALKVEK